MTEQFSLTHNHFRRYINILFNDKCTSNINKWSDFYLTSDISLVLRDHQVVSDYVVTWCLPP